MWPKLDFIYNFFAKKNDAADLQREFDNVLDLAQATCQEYEEEHFIEKQVDELIEATSEECTLSQGIVYR